MDSKGNTDTLDWMGIRDTTGRVAHNKVLLRSCMCPLMGTYCSQVDNKMGLPLVASF